VPRKSHGTLMEHPDDRPGYEAAADAAPARPPLRGDARCDVCVVGAGYTGLSAALHLRERGYDVVVLEARSVGWGASGRNGGQLLSGLAPDMLDVVEILGRDKAQQVWNLAEEAKAEVRARIERYGIDCGLRRGALAAATRPRHLDHLARELALWRELGYAAAREVDRAGIRAMVDSPLYLGGVADDGAFHLRPLAYAHGLAAAAEAAGVRIFEATPVAAVEPGPRPLARTAAGAVSAQHLMLCGNAYLGALVPYVHHRLATVTTYVAATEPLGAARARALIPADVAVADSRAVPDYFRLSDDRLVFGAGATYWRPLADPAALLRRRMAEVFPQLGPVAFEHVWSGRIGVTVNRMPLIGRLDGNLWYACGFAGHGLGIAGLAGRLLAEAVSGTAERFDLLAKVRHLPFPGGPLRLPLLALGMLWHRLREFA